MNALSPILPDGAGARIAARLAGLSKAAPVAEPYAFKPEDRPAFPGTPYSPPLTLARRSGYAAAMLVCALLASFPNTLVGNPNTNSLAAGWGVFVAQAAVLPAFYVAFNATANLTLVKARQQFGIPAVILPVLGLYAVAALVQLVWPTFQGAMVLRAVDGLAGGGLTTMSITYAFQVFPPRMRPVALLVGITLPQLGPPLARLVPVEALSANFGLGLHLIELGSALLPMAVLLAFPLPPSVRVKVFERLDALTVGLMVPGMLLLCVVLAEGRYLWWADTPWLGWALAGGFALVVTAMTIEHNRARPLLHTRWIATLDIARIAAVAFLVRVTLAEQTYGSVGLLTSGGLTNDQLRVLFALVALAMVAGLVTAALLLSEPRLPYLVLGALLTIALGAWLDSHATSLTRPPQLYLSQALIGFGTTLFIGPTLVYAILRVLRRGPDVFATTIVLFSTSQNVGGLVGSALLGTYQTAAVRAHAAALSERLLGSDPQVAARLQAGVQQLNQALNREATTLAYNDVFSLVMALALSTAAYVVYLIIFNAVRQRRLARAEAQS